jgi:hypothetical protein
MIDESIYTPEEEMEHIWDIEDIKTLMHKRVYMQSWDKREEEIENLWVSEPEHQKTASYGSNWGYYTGMDSIRSYYVDAHQKWLEKQKEENGAAELNQGNLYAHPISTGLVEVAIDGKTAKGLWYSIGQETTAQADGRGKAWWMLGKVAVDFIKEGDDWKIWHIVISTDVDAEAGHDYGEYPVYVNWGNDSDNPVRKEFGKPDIEVLTHDVTFNWWDNYPAMPPKDYQTWSDDISYGPEGYKPPKVQGFHAGEGRNFK